MALLASRSDASLSCRAAFKIRFRPKFSVEFGGCWGQESPFNGEDPNQGPPGGGSQELIIEEYRPREDDFVRWKRVIVGRWMTQA